MCYKQIVLNFIHSYIGKFYILFFLICIGSASGPAVDTDNVVTVKKKEECAKVVDTVFQLLEKRITAKQILTKKVNTQENHLIVVLVYVTRPTKIDHVSTNYIKLYFQ